MKHVLSFSVAACIIFLNSCVTFKEPIVIVNKNIKDYRYGYIPATSIKSGSAGGIYSGIFLYESKNVNPKEIISGTLSKHGFIVVQEINPELKSQTLIVSYGESGKRDIAGGLLGYTLEVTIQFISAETSELVSSCTAEGAGDTEADDIRIAINRALSKLIDD